MTPSTPTQINGATQIRPGSTPLSAIDQAQLFQALVPNAPRNPIGGMTPHVITQLPLVTDEGGALRVPGLPELRSGYVTILDGMSMEVRQVTESGVSPYVVTTSELLENDVMLAATLVNTYGAVITNLAGVAVLKDGYGALGLVPGDAVTLAQRMPRPESNSGGGAAGPAITTQRQSWDYVNDSSWMVLMYPPLPGELVSVNGLLVESYVLQDNGAGEFNLAVQNCTAGDRVTIRYQTTQSGV